MAWYHGSLPPFEFLSETLETLKAPRKGRGFVDTYSQDGVGKGTSWVAEGRFVLLEILGGGAGSLVYAEEEFLYPGGEVVAPERSGCELRSPEEDCFDGWSPLRPLLLLVLDTMTIRTRAAVVFVVASHVRLNEQLVLLAGSGRGSFVIHLSRIAGVVVPGQQR